MELTELAGALGIGRATIYRWFGSRDQLLGGVIADALERLIEDAHTAVGRGGAAGLLEVLDHVNRRLSRSTALRALLEQERSAALRLLTAGGGFVQPRAVRMVRRMIEAEIDGGRFEAPADPEALAYAVVRLAEAFLYNEAAAGLREHPDQLHDVEAALLGIPGAAPARGSALARGSAPARGPGPASGSAAEPMTGIAADELVLRPLAVGDESELLRIHRRPEVVRWWDEPSEGFPWDEPQSIRLTIELRGKIAGLIQYWEETEPKYRHASIDVFLDPAWHGRGIGSEAVRRVVAELVQGRGHHRVTIDPALANTAAIRAYGKAGFRPVGVMRRAERDADGRGWHDDLLMELVVSG